MIQVTLTKSEVETLKLYLQANPCNAGCSLNYSRIDCADMNAEGIYSCRLMRDTQSIAKKLGFGWEI